MGNRISTFVVVFDKDKKHVLMEWLENSNRYDFIADHSYSVYNCSLAGDRILYEKTGIPVGEVELRTMINWKISDRTSKTLDKDSIFVTAGIMNEDIGPVSRDGFLTWVPVWSRDLFYFETPGDGIRGVILKTVADKLGVDLGWEEK